MFKSPLEQIKFETKYQILIREIEIEVTLEKLANLRTKLITTKDKQEVVSINTLIANYDSSARTLEVEIDYFKEKLEICDWPRWTA